MAGTGWDGHLPSNKLEREIINAIEGFEDEDGKTNGLLSQDDPDMAMVRSGFHAKKETGPKGVISDSRLFNAKAALQREADRARQLAALKQKANATVRAFGEDDEEDDDEEDDEEFRRYKLERLREMQQHAQQSASQPTFGSLYDVEALDMPSAIDNAGSASTFVVVHLHVEFLASCVLLDVKLEECARKHDQVKFMRVCATDASEKIKQEDLPILMAYQDGKFLASAERVGRQAKEGLELGAVEKELLALGVRLSASSAMREADKAMLSRLRELDMGDDEEAAAEEEEEEDEDEDDDEDERGRGGARGRYFGRHS